MADVIEAKALEKVFPGKKGQAAVRALAGVTYADPLRFAIDAVRRIYLEGATLREIASDFLPMLGVAAVAMPLAGWLFRKRS